MHICAASAPVFDDSLGPRPVNRARLFTPLGGCGVQDKQIMTRFEREDWDVVPGGGLQVFDTALGKIGILICYDSEFPLLARACRDAELMLVPSCTEALAGYWRVRIGAMARALENQCVTAMASLVGDAAWCPQSMGIPAWAAFSARLTPAFRQPASSPRAAESARAGPMARSIWRRWPCARDGVVLNRAHWAGAGRPRRQSDKPSACVDYPLEKDAEWPI